MAPHPTPARLVLGLLGGVACGKSTVARVLEARAGARVVDADLLARAALEAAARDGRLASALGPWAVAPDGAPDRAEIARRVFEDAALLRALERITHPAVHACIADAIDAHRSGEGPALLVLDVPLLLEAGLDARCDILWFVQSPETVRLARAASRQGLSAAQVRKREGAQASLERKRARADLVLSNDGDAAHLERQVMDGLRAIGALP